MIFTEHHVKAILNGTKTQTRRVCKANEQLHHDSWTSETAVVQVLPPPMPPKYKPRYRTKWRVGNTYAVQPGRGKCGVARIRVTGIRRERLQSISKNDALAEGILQTGYDKYMHVFCYTHSATRWVWPDPVEAYCHLWYSINKAKGTRWADDPDVWVLEFEAVTHETV